MDRGNIMKKILIFALATLMLTALVGCSMVFEAGISGTVETKDGTGTKPVSGVRVFVYTDKAVRDADFAKFEAKSITSPSPSSGYVTSSTTDANGNFTVNKIVWETHKSEFGKTGDVTKLYLIFYHKDYKVAQCDATVISGSTNASNIKQNLVCSKDYSNVRVNVYDVTTGNLMTSPCTLEYKVNGSTESDKIVMTGSTTFEISYDKGITDPTIFLDLSANGTNWKMTKSTGEDVNVSDKTFDIESGSMVINLYMKNHELVLPGFSGDIDGTDTDHSTVSNSNDNVSVCLKYRDKNGTYKAFSETVDANHVTYAERQVAGNNVHYVHGKFSGIGNNGNYSITVNSANYPDIAINTNGKTYSIELMLVFDFGGVEKTYSFTYSSLTSSNLGHIDLV